MTANYWKQFNKLVRPLTANDLKAMLEAMQDAGFLTDCLTVTAWDRGDTLYIRITDVSEKTAP